MKSTMRHLGRRADWNGKGPPLENVVGLGQGPYVLSTNSRPDDN